MIMISETPKIKEEINWFVLLEMLLCTAIIWFTCSKNTTMASHAFTASFIVLFIFFLKYIASRMQEMDSLDGYLIAIIFLSFINVLFSLLIAGKSVNFENLKNYFIFLSTVIFFRLAEQIKLNRKTCNYIFGLNMVISVIYVYCKRAYPQVYLENSFNGLNLNFSNPNLAGMFLFLTLLYMFLGFFYYKNVAMKAICLVLGLVDFSYMLKTEARNPLLAFALFLGIFILSFIKLNLRFSKMFNFLVNIAPIVFVFLYLTLINNIIQKGWFDFLVSEGKSLNSRVGIWQERLASVGNKWLIGNYAESGGNAHNSHMVLLCSFGVIVLILVIIFTYKLTCLLSERITNRFQLCCVTAVYAIIFMGFGEGVLYSGGQGIYIMCGIFIILSNSELGIKNGENGMKI